MLPTVSILVPAYNAERWIAEALESALAQTWKQTEIIVVDDGSRDQTRLVADRYQSAGVKVFHQQNEGSAAARNHAFAESRGDFIQYLDADDLLSPDKIAEQVELLQRNPPRMLAVSPWTYFFDGQAPAEGRAQDQWPVADCDDPVNFLVELMGPNGQFAEVPPGAWLTPRSLAAKAGAWDHLRSPDDDGLYFARVVLASAGIRRSPHGRFYYRKHPQGGSLTSTRSQQLVRGAFATTDLKVKLLLARTQEPRAKSAAVHAYMHRAFEAYPFCPEVTDMALQRVRELGGTSFVPPFPTWKGQLLSRLIGWKAAKRAQTWWHAWLRAQSPS